MVEAAPRLDPRLVAAVSVLDDSRQSMAETNRRVGALATELNLPRPSYAHVRRLVLAERARCAERRARLTELDRTLAGIMRHRHPYELFGR